MNPRAKTKGRMRYVLVGLLLIACGGVLSKPQGGGESHFLERCVDDCGGGLECVADVCTRGCLVGESSCTDLLPAAICTDQSIEPGAVAVCDVACSSAGDCAGLGADFECEIGFCRQPPILPSPEPPLDAGVEAGPDASDSGAVTTGSPCTVSTSNTCADGYLCMDDAGDDCDPDSVEGCAGSCVTPLTVSPCVVYGLPVPCPDGLSCVVHPDSALSPEPVGYCVGQEAVGACSETVACDQGFVCDIAARVDKTSGDCVPEAIDCTLTLSGCVELPIPPCPSGYTHADVDCGGPCVPIPSCVCTLDSDCPPDSICDRSTGRCAHLHWSPPEICAQAFDPGPCDAALPVYAAVDGACVLQTYGGCGGNDNRFTSIEECMGVCEGRPFANPCPDGRVEALVCAGCGVVGGCSPQLLACAKQCTSDDECEGEFTCHDGICEVWGCL
jgi:hypothetical protein